jgi:hypothetical protein
MAKLIVTHLVEIFPAFNKTPEFQVGFDVLTAVTPCSLVEILWLQKMVGLVYEGFMFITAR